MRYLRYCFLLTPIVIMMACSPKVTNNTVKIVAPSDSAKTKAIVVNDANAKPQVVVVPGPFAKTDSFYTVKADSLLGLARLQKPVMLTLDTTGATVPSNWVGTVNFGIRKPNYVIIHFTGQDSIQQTLKTFTLTGPQTSAHYVIAK